MMNKEVIKIDGNSFEVYRIVNDVYGNPRYLIHFLTLGLSDYISIAAETGFKKYRGKSFGGGYVFSSYNLKETLEHALKVLKANDLI